MMPETKSKEQLLDQFMKEYYSIMKEWHSDPEFRAEVKNTLGFASYVKDYYMNNFMISICRELESIVKKVKKFFLSK